eukprot:2393463-Amphidinium_carterae.2
MFVYRTWARGTSALFRTTNETLNVSMDVYGATLRVVVPSSISSGAHALAMSVFGTDANELFDIGEDGSAVLS